MIPLKCNACDGALKTRFSSVIDPQTQQTFSIDACEACGLGHTSPQPDDLKPYYGSEYHGGRHGLTATLCARRRLRLVTTVVGKNPGRRLLDVGCGDGTFLLAAKERGWSVVGTEMNVETASGSGLDVRKSLDDLGGSTFDCITLWHSLEHLRDPRGALGQISQLLDPNGFLIVAVPDAEGYQARAFGSEWFHLDVPRHLYHFGNRSLTGLLSAVGLRVLRRGHQEFEYDVFGWAQSALNKMLPVPNTLFYLLTGRPTRAGRAQLAATALLGVGATTLAVPATAFTALSRRGGTLIAVASR
jgi:SAM-dependent methyltransferase